MRPDMADHSKPVRSDSNAPNRTPHTTGLNPLAQEFVPARRPQPRTYYTQNTNPPEYDYRYEYFDHNSAYQHMPSVSSVQQRLRVKRPSLNTPEEYREFMFSDNYDPVCKINEVVDLLNNKPARYDFIIGPLADSMAEPLKTKEFSELVVKLITSQAVGKPNFRYNAARICLIFDKLADCFRAVLLKECLEDIRRYVDISQKEKVRFEQKISSVCGCALFVSEIYTQLISADGFDHTSAMKDLSIGLIQIFNLLIRPDKDCIKSVCQALKLCGSQLNLRIPEGLSHLITKLSDIPKQFNDISIERLVGSVVNLSGMSWGQSDVPLSIAHAQRLDSFSEGARGLKYVEPGSNPLVYDEITYYGPDGQIISEEEANFLFSNLRGDTPVNDAYVGDENGDDGDSLWDPNNEIDPEIQAAFKEFVQYSAQNNG